MSKRLVFEFNGVVRILARQREVQLTIVDNATWRDVVAALSSAAPALVGEVIAKDRRSFVGDYLINIEGTTTVSDLDETVTAADGAHLILLNDLC
jgi:hypothetical protein